MRTVSVQERRRAMIRRHHLAGDASGPEAVTRALLALHATDPAWVYLAVSTPLAAVLRTRLISQLERNGTEPPIGGDVKAWLDDLASRVEHALDKRGTATGAQLSNDEPELKTSILVRAPSDRPQNVTTGLLTLWLTRFGPATVEDLQWWTGWNNTTVRRALGNLPIAEIDLHGQPGITLCERHERAVGDTHGEPGGDFERAGR